MAPCPYVAINGETIDDKRANSKAFVSAFQASPWNYAYGDAFTAENQDEWIQHFCTDYEVPDLCFAV